MAAPDRSLRLAYLADPNSLHTRRWLAFFAERGHEVVLLDPYGTDVQPGLPEPVRVVRLGPHPPRWPKLPLGLRRELRAAVARLRPDVLHAHYVRRFGWAASLAAFHPCVVSPWGSDVLLQAGPLTRWWNRRALRGADLVTVTSDHVRRAVVAAGARPDRVRIVQHGVDTAAFSPGHPDPSLAERLGVNGRRVVFSPRALRPVYRQETVLEAFARLGEDAALLMTDAAADPAYRAALEARARELGVADRVRVVPAVPHAEMPAHLRLADVVVSVPESDSFPLTVQEAMAVGVPVVASDLPAARAVLGEIAPEALVPVGDVEATARALRRALELTPEERRDLGERLRDHVVGTGDYRSNMELMERLYLELAERRRG
ncbi:MAG TPA: glycosyltransferase [candidate division Zixibacteria bacterium]|nr:glycosyltransferase [candidate division Zixibacteria bacterium]